MLKRRFLPVRGQFFSIFGQNEAKLHFFDIFIDFMGGANYIFRGFQSPALLKYPEK
jgi:hypothetical protein